MPLGGTGKIKVDNPSRSEPDVVVRHVSRTCFEAVWECLGLSGARRGRLSGCGARYDETRRE